MAVAGAVIAISTPSTIYAAFTWSVGGGRTDVRGVTGALLTGGLMVAVESWGDNGARDGL
jgi:hypothetical protein